MRELEFIKILNVIQGSLRELPGLPSGKERRELLTKTLEYIDDARVRVIFDTKNVDKVYGNTKKSNGNLRTKEEVIA